MVDPSRIRLTGPLLVHRDGLWSDLLAKGYSPLSSANLLWLAADLDRWLLEKRLRLDELGADKVDEFVQHRRASGRTHFVSQRGMFPVLDYLRRVGAVRTFEEEPTEETPLKRVLREYGEYLARERGLVPTTVRGYERIADEFLSGRFGPTTSEIGRLSAADVTGFVLREVRSLSVGSAKLMVAALRSLLRYLQIRGDLANDLTAAVPAVAGVRLAGLPKALDHHEVVKLLRSCDRRTRVGRRDFAALLLMTHLGLRAAEVAALKLDDVHWARGEITVRGKGRRQDRMPLPHEVGAAMASYLRWARPRTESRNLFMGVRAPFGDLTHHGVKAIVQQAGSRIGHSHLGSHRLRHSAATEMLRRGASMPQIAQVLRHRALASTAIYAKVDREPLRALALPWPEKEAR